MSWISCFFKFLYSFFVFLFFILYVLYLNPGCLKCISCTNLSPENKNLITISLILYSWNKREINKGILLESVFIPKPLNNPLASCSLINLDFLLSQTANFDKGIILPVFCRYIFLIFTFCISSALQTIRQHCFINRIKLSITYLSL